MISSGPAPVVVQDDYAETTEFGPFPNCTQITVKLQSLDGGGTEQGFSALVQLLKGSQGDVQELPEFSIQAPGVFSLANHCLGFRIRNMVGGQACQYSAQAWFPDDPLYMTQVGGVGPPSGAGALTTTDGSTVVDPTTELLIDPSIVLSNPSAGVAELSVDVPGTLFNQAQQETLQGTITLANGASGKMVWSHDGGSTLTSLATSTDPQLLVGGLYLLRAQVSGLIVTGMNGTAQMVYGLHIGGDENSPADWPMVDTSIEATGSGQAGLDGLRAANKNLAVFITNASGKTTTFDGIQTIVLVAPAP